MDDEKPGMTQRERRRQQHEKTRPKVQMSDRTRNRLIVGGLLLLVGGGVATGMILTATQDAACPGHWHAGYTVFIDDESIPFNSPRFATPDNTEAPGTHVHGDDGIYHFHPATSRCTPFEDGLANLGVRVTADRLVLDDAHGDRAGTYETNETLDLRMFSKTIGGNWTEVENFGRYLRDQPPDGAAMFITYGALTDEIIESQKQRATGMEGTSYDPRR